MPVCKSTRPALESSLCNEEQLEEEQQEVSREEDLPCVPDCTQAEGELVCGDELAEAPVTPQPLLGWLPGVSSGRAPVSRVTPAPAVNGGPNLRDYRSWGA